jgi:ABC-type nitrate/sulfonate/bicarbonate transport system substrate-binding protein
MENCLYSPDVITFAREKGWFKDAGINLKEVHFTAGPVMVEALSSNAWDLGISGIGGQVPGVLTYDAVLVAPINPDDGAQYLFVRKNSPILAAGTGKNTIDPRIYGDAASWKGKRVLCNTGAVLHYFLIKVLGGFGLGTSDVQFMAVEVATARSAFMAGAGDVVALTGSAGALQMLADPDYTHIAYGPWAKTGLMGCSYANKNSIADPNKKEAMVEFFKVYHKSLEWIKDPKNYNESVDMMMEYLDEMGNTMDRPSAEAYLKIDPYYSIQEALSMMTTKAPGKDYSIMEDNIINVLNFFIESGSRKQGDAEKLLGHLDPSIYTELLKQYK